jgi:sulfite oxidase
MLIFYSDLFYVRNHLPVPEVDPETYSLEITGIGVKTISLSLHDLKTKFPKHTVTAAVQCAGNRRSEMSKVAELQYYNFKLKFTCHNVQLNFKLLLCWCPATQGG